MCLVKIRHIRHFAMLGNGRYQDVQNFVQVTMIGRISLGLYRVLWLVICNPGQSATFLACAEQLVAHVLPLALYMYSLVLYRSIQFCILPHFL